MIVTMLTKICDEILEKVTRRREGFVMGDFNVRLGSDSDSDRCFR